MQLSVAMCTYNGARFLQQQLQSLAGQDRAPDELVVCDDGSQDQTVQILREFAARSPFPVRLQVNPAKLGVTRNFEQAMALCQGQILCLADQDDVWLPGKLARLESILAADERLGAVFCNGQVTDEQLHPLGYSLWDALWFGRREQRKVRQGRALEVFLRHTVAAGGTLAFRAAFRELLLPIPDLRSAHDAWVAMLVAAVADVTIVDEQLIQYRLHTTNHVGLQRVGLWQQIAKARLQVQHHAFRYAWQLHQAAYDRLMQWEAQGHTLRPGSLHLLREKVAHSHARDAMRGGLLRRLPAIVGETARLRYARYSYGWKSVAQDLFLR